jgi:hypothetical protein
MPVSCDRFSHQHNSSVIMFSDHIFVQFFIRESSLVSVPCIYWTTQHRSSAQTSVLISQMLAPTLYTIDNVQPNKYHEIKSWGTNINSGSSDVLTACLKRMQFPYSVTSSCSFIMYRAHLSWCKNFTPMNRVNLQSSISYCYFIVLNSLEWNRAHYYCGLLLACCSSRGWLIDGAGYGEWNERVAGATEILGKTWHRAALSTRDPTRLYPGSNPATTPWSVSMLPFASACCSNVHFVMRWTKPRLSLQVTSVHFCRRCANRYIKVGVISWGHAF